MEKEPLKAHAFTEQLVQGKIAVFIIAQDRVINHCQMPPYLVHAACSQFQFQEGIVLVYRT
jgi:hypothetical protein